MLRIVLVVSLLLSGGLAHARQLHVGLVIPQQGPFAAFGAQAREAFTAWELANPGVFADTVEGDDDCSAASGADAAAAMSEAGVDIVVGFVCTESLAAALPMLSAEGIPVMTLSVRADIISEESKRLGWTFFQLAPRASEEAEVASDAIFNLWADKPFAIIEDGTIEGRELAEAVRTTLEDRGLKASFIDNYRPGQDRQPSLVRRLKAAGVSRVFVGGERSDLAIIARDAREQGLALRFMGGDALNAARGDNPLPEGTLAIIAAQSLVGASADEARARLADLGLIAKGLRIPAYAAADILGAAASRMRFDDTSITQFLLDRRFATAIGPVSFNDKGERREPGFSLAEWRDGKFHRISPRQAAQNDNQSQ